MSKKLPIPALRDQPLRGRSQNDLAGGQAHLDSAQRWRRFAIYEQLDLPGTPVVDHPHFVPLLFGQGSGPLRRADTRTIAAIDMEHAVMGLVIRVVVGDVNVVEVVLVAIGVDEHQRRLPVPQRLRLALHFRRECDGNVIGRVGDRKLSGPARMFGGARDEQVQRREAIDFFNFPVRADRDYPAHAERLNPIGRVQQRRQQEDGGGEASNHGLMIIPAA